MALVWTPLVNSLVEIQEDLVFMISPFIQETTLKRLENICKFSKKLAVITRWNAGDIISGASDLAIYPFLKSKGIRLYINKSIHLKLLLYSNNRALVSSGNITDHGLGFAQVPNVEAGLFSHVDFEDWKKIFFLIEDSILVNDEMYLRAIEYRDKHKDHAPIIPEFVISETDKIMQIKKKEFSLGALPASESPHSLFKHRMCACNTKIDIETQSPYLHDMMVYNLSPTMDEAEFMNSLKNSFLAAPFVKKLVSYIKENAPLSFGAMTVWVHEHCSDVPLPYRYEIKKHIAILYDWLAFFVPEISWDIPGKRSQVIYWNS